jgi:hypothetical protein
LGAATGPLCGRVAFPKYDVAVYLTGMATLYHKRPRRNPHALAPSGEPHCLSLETMPAWSLWQPGQRCPAIARAYLRLVLGGAAAHLPHCHVLPGGQRNRQLLPVGRRFWRLAQAPAGLPFATALSQSAFNAVVCYGCPLSYVLDERKQALCSKLVKADCRQCALPRKIKLLMAMAFDTAASAKAA